MPIVAIIGIDGSGKTTQAKLLVQRLREKGIAARYVRPDYILIEILSSLKLNVERFLPSPRRRRAGPDSSQRKKGRSVFSGIALGILGYLYAWKSYAILAFYGRGGRVVVCDRYFYQFFYDIYGPGSRKVARFFPRPDIAYFLDGSMELFRSRMTNPFDKGVSPLYYAEVRSLFIQLSRDCSFVTVDASQDIAAISDFIFSHYSEKKMTECRGDS